MITSAAEERIRNVFTKGDQLVIVLSDGRKHSVPLAWYPRLLNASEEQRSDWRLIGGGHGVHWPQIDEDLSVDGLLRGVPAPDAHTDASPVAGTEWLGAMRSLAEQIQKQQQTSQQMTQELMNTYMQLLNTPGSSLSGQAEQQQTLQQQAQQWMEQAQQQHQTLQQTAQKWIEQAQQQQQSFQQQAQQQQQSFQQMTRELMNTYSELYNIPISYVREGLRDAQFFIEGYDELTVEEASARLGALSPEDLREVRDYEERNKNRETILKELDRRIRGGS